MREQTPCAGGDIWGSSQLSGRCFSFIGLANQQSFLASDRLAFIRSFGNNGAGSCRVVPVSGNEKTSRRVDDPEAFL